MEEEMKTNILLRPGIDRILDALGQQHRRRILVELNGGGVEHMNDVVMRGPNAEREEIELIQNHLPKLAATSYIEWDRETGEISRGPDFDEIAPLLELIENHADELPPGWP